jgi:hypothetical protein
MRIRILPLTFLLKNNPKWHSSKYDANPDPTFHYDADLDQAFKNDADPSGSGSAALIKTQTPEVSSVNLKLLCSR